MDIRTRIALFILDWSCSCPFMVFYIRSFCCKHLI
ncbi:MAG: SWIM zinc finger family protein [Prevotella sp.]|nr:SWIM zinc finger family protein [Prevotella sp.]